MTGQEARDLELLRRFEPIVRYTHGELFFPMSAEPYIAACELWAGTSVRDAELLVPLGEFEHAGWTTVIASQHAGACVGMLGAEVQAALALKDVVASDYDAIVFVGGNGARMLFDDREA